MSDPTDNQIEPGDILLFWFGELDAQGRADKAHQGRWWVKDPVVDADIRDRFGSTHAAITRGEREDWLADARSRLAYIVVLDQFSRNMFRGSAGMFAADDQARGAVSSGIDAGHDRLLALDERSMFYMPLMHSEALSDQERCVQLFQELAAELSGSAKASLLNQVGFAERHRDIVKRFGRFPHRNALLGRASTPDELAFLEQPGSSF